VVKLLQPGYEYVPSPESTSEIGESDDGRTGDEDGKDQYSHYRMMLLEGKGEEEMPRENGKRGGWGLAGLEV
jgi:hypothetical protein